MISGEKKHPAFYGGKGEGGMAFNLSAEVILLDYLFSFFYFPRLNCTGGKTGSVPSSFPRSERGNQ